MNSEKETSTMGLHPIFKACCGVNNRYSIDRPFSAGGYIYATNGQICVRTPGEIDNGEGTFPPAEKLNWNFPKDGELIRLDNLPAKQKDVVCRECRGSGRLSCDECHGSGKVICEYGHYHDCPECEGQFHSEGSCLGCKGNGTVTPAPRVLVFSTGVGDVRLREDCARILAEHGANLYAASGMRQLPFAVGDSIEGLLSACDRHPYEVRVGSGASKEAA